MTTIESGKRTECEGAELYYKVSDDKSTRLSDSIVDQNKTYHQSNNDFTTSKDRKSTRLNSSHRSLSRMPSSA